MNNIIALLLLIPNILLSQEILKGNVLDYETKEPISGANIFISNTTFSTISNAEGHFKINANLSNNEIIIRHLGYEVVRLNLSSIKEFTTTKTIYLNKTTNNLDAVVINMEKPKDRKNALTIFKEYFIGKSQLASKTEILNESDIQFRVNKSNDNHKDYYNLIAFSNSPILIINKKLGYKISYELVDFEYNRDSISENSFAYYKGYSQFTDITDEYKLDRDNVLENRKKAYYGSPMHFTRSLFLKSYEEEGFTIKSFTKELNPAYQKSNFIERGPSNHYHKYITTFSKENLTPDNLITEEGNKKYISFKNYISVVYSKAKEDNNYAIAFDKLREKFQTSQIMLKDSKIEVLPDGNNADNDKIIFYGHMSWQKIGDSLPFDYQP